MTVKFYQVGGCVRDELLGVRSKDIDYSVEAESYEDMRNAIVLRGGEIFLETPEYFTIRAKVPGMGACDFVLCRKDGQYSDGRRPDKVEMGTLYDDLARRDFTMNAIAKQEDGGYVDPHGGIHDIELRMITAVGSAYNRFHEDYLRMLRAIRFCVTKRFVLSAEVDDAIRKMGHRIAEVSVERIREELLKAFQVDTIATLFLLREYGLDKIVFDKRLGLRLEPTLKK